MHSIRVAFCADGPFIPPLSAALLSIRKGVLDTDNAVVYIIGDVDQSDRKRLKRTSGTALKLEFRRPDPAMLPPTLPTTENISRAMYYRVVLPYLLPKHVKKVLYLDVDVLVHGNISDFWLISMDDHVALAVQDAEVVNMSNVPGHTSAGYAPYFNSGVLMMDLEAWRKQAITERFLKYMDVYASDVIFPDQDALNAVLHDKWKPVCERWNIQTALVDGRVPNDEDKSRYLSQVRGKLPDLLQQSHIMHYTQGRKPWHLLCSHPYKDRFLENFRQSSFFRTDFQYYSWLVRDNVLRLLRKGSVRARDVSPF